MSGSEGPMTAARRRFFTSEGIELPPFVSSDWRGCVLDRDVFDHTRMPRVLFEAIVAAAKPESLWVCGYGMHGESCVGLPPDWDAYRAHVFTQENYSPERLMFDASGRWALLAGFETTELGAEATLANAIDEELQKSSTFLSALTREAYPLIETAGFASYVEAVLGH